MPAGPELPILSETLRSRSLEALPSAALVTDAEQRILYANQAFRDLTGYGDVELLGKNCRLLQGAETDLVTVAAIRDRLTAGLGFRGEILNYRADGEPFWNQLAIEPLRDTGGDLTHFLSAQSDVTLAVRRHLAGIQQRETAEFLLDIATRLARSNSRGSIARTLAEAVTRLGFERSAVALLDDARGHLQMTAVDGWPTESAARALGFTTTPTELPELAEVLTAPRQLLVTVESGSEQARAQLTARRLTGYLATPVGSPGAPPHGLLLAYWAATPPPAAVPTLQAERLTALAGLAELALDHADAVGRIRRDAEEDPVTGLATRLALHRALTRMINASATGPIAVVYGDLDHFKRINDTLGHHGGDELLHQVALRFRSAARPSEFLARPGGDEFVAVLPDVHDESAVTGFIRRMQSSLEPPFHIDGTKLYITISLGWATGRHRGSTPPDEAAGALLKAADSQMYQAKQRRPRVPAAGIDNSIALDTALHEAVENGAIGAYFQPQYDARTGRLVGYEALARWHHDHLGEIAPSVFVPVAEDNGLIHALGRQILERACRFAERAAAVQPGSMRIQVNVSTLELAQPGYPAMTLALLAQWPDRTWTLGLEVTESALIHDRAGVEAALRILRSNDVGISVDDFGSGYSSLSQLQDLPATELKIDRSFVQREDAVGVSLLRAILDLGHSLQLEVVAEGIETEQQLATLRQLGCDRLQGFLLAPPLPAEAALIAAPRSLSGALADIDQER